jgi:nonribosomal peptide synthetase protein VioF
VSANDIDNWDLLSAADKAAFDQLNSTDTSFAADTVVDRLLLVAERAPDAAAVSLAEDVLTYAQLRSRAVGVAIRLKRRGFDVGDVCAVFMTRRIELYPVILGIMLAGGVVAPLDVTAPAGRLARCLEIARARVLICDPELRESAPRLDGAILDLDEVLDAEADRMCPESAGAVTRVDRSAGAYLVFTSGTTGLPKPVLVGHWSLANLIAGLGDALRVDGDSRLTQSAPIHFDASWQQIYCAWSAGATLLPVPDAVRVNGTAMARWLVRERVTHYDTVPSLWYPVVRALTANPELARPTPAVLVLAGEELRPGPVSEWMRDICPLTRIYNVYGPTEATIDATYYPCELPPETGSMPIGRPLPNIRCYVLNNALAQCPVGVPGELYIGGEALAAGYVGHARGTAEKFLPDPFSGEPGARMYATGDRVRLLASGDLQYEGRLDAMVKVRGVRLDLGDVESALRSLDAVADAVVVHDPTSDRLVAFLQPVPGEGPDDNAVYQGLAQHLPPAYLPAVLIRLDKLPLTVAGKLDRTLLARRALSAEAGGRADPGSGPATPTERALVEIWARLLNRPEIGLDDNFFALGGDSISSIVLRDRAAARGIRVDVLDVFKGPTVRQLAELADSRASASPRVVSVADRATSGLGLLSGQETFYWEAVAETDQTALTVQESYRLAGPVDPERFEDALNIMIERHPALRAVLVLEADVPVHRFEDRPRLPVPVISADPDGDELLADIRARRRREMAVDRWPLFDLTLVRLGHERHELIWTMHHVLSDGWSHALLREELFTLYGEIGRGFFMPTAEADDDPYRRVLEAAAGRRLAADPAFWADYLGGHRPTHLPRDGRGSAGARRRIVSLRLDGKPREAVSRTAKQVGTSENRVVLSLVAGVLQQFTGSADVSLLYVTSGRGRLVGDTRAVGCMVNVVPLRIAADRLLGDADMLAAVSGALTRVAPHEEIPLGQVLRYAGIDSVQALSDVTFLFQNYPQIADLDALAPDSADGFTIEAYEDAEEARRPLSVICYPDREALVIDLDYNPEALSAGAAAAFGDLLLDRVEGL